MIQLPPDYRSTASASASDLADRSSIPVSAWLAAAAGVVVVGLTLIHPEGITPAVQRLSWAQRELHRCVEEPTSQLSSPGRERISEQDRHSHSTSEHHRWGAHLSHHSKQPTKQFK